MFDGQEIRGFGGFGSQIRSVKDARRTAHSRMFDTKVLFFSRFFWWSLKRIESAKFRWFFYREHMSRVWSVFSLCVRPSELQRTTQDNFFSRDAFSDSPRAPSSGGVGFSSRKSARTIDGALHCLGQAFDDGASQNQRQRPGKERQEHGRSSQNGRIRWFHPRGLGLALPLPGLLGLVPIEKTPLRV